MKALTEHQRDILYKLSKVPSGHALQVSGHAMTICSTLAKRGFAKFIAQDKWTGAFYEITAAGREAAAR